MKSKSASGWSAAKSEEHYGFKRWGQGHIAVDDAGFVRVEPRLDGRGIRIMVKPREGVRLLELYESQMLNKTYLNIEPKNGRKKRAK